MLPFTRIISGHCKYNGMKVIPFVIHSYGDSVLFDRPIVLLMGISLNPLYPLPLCLCGLGLFRKYCTLTDTSGISLSRTEPLLNLNTLH